MESLSMQLRFLDFNELPEDKVQSIRNILNCPCSAVQLPFGVSLPIVDSYDSSEQDVYNQRVAEPSTESTVNYGVPVVTMVNPYSTHIQQTPMCPMANGNFLATCTANQMPHIVFVPEIMDGIPNGATSSLKQGLESGCSSNGPNSGVVVSNPYHHHIGMFHCPPPAHHSPQYVMSHIHPAAYISTYLPQPPSSSVCKSTMAAAAELSMPTVVSNANFVNQHVPVSSLLPMTMSAPTRPSLEMADHTAPARPSLEMADPTAPARRSLEMADPTIPGHDSSGDLDVDEEDVCLEHVVVEVPPVIDQPASSISVPATAATTAVHERKPLYPTVHEDEFKFLCEDQLCTSGPATTVEENLANVESDHVLNPTVTNEVPQQLRDDIVESLPVVDSAVPVTVVAEHPPEDDSQKCPPAQEAPGQAMLWTSLFKRKASLVPPVESPKSSPAASVTCTSSPQVNAAEKPRSEQVGHCSNQPASPANSVPVKSYESSFKRNSKKREINFQKKDVPKSNGIVTETSVSPSLLGDILSRAVLDNRHPSYVIRGLRNCGNWCYVNSILQALLVCDPLYNLLYSLKACHALGELKASSPIIDSMVEFIIQYTITPDRKISEESYKHANKRAIAANFIGPVFDPVCVYDMLPHLKLNAFEGRQEDAEEFLSCLLNGLHDEMAKAMTYSSNANATNAVKNGADNNFLPNGNADKNADNDSADEESWKVIEPRNKCSITRSTSFPSSPLSDIFCGRMRSAVLASSTSSATLQPFFTLLLDVQSESVTTVAEALHFFVMKESLQDYHCAKTKQEIVASRQITLEELPPVLILHLKRFVYCKDGGCMKVSKKVDFDIDLHFQKELLSPAARAKILPKQRNYKLVAVIYHCGNEAVKGHYITDVCNEIGDVWFRTDDSRVTRVRQSSVLNHPRDFVPYLLFYRHMDTVQVPPQKPRDVASVK